MKLISTQEANNLLYSQQMQVGDWGQISDIVSLNTPKRQWVNFAGPKDYLLNFSQHIAGWVPKGKWKIFQIDNSTGDLDLIQASFIGSMLFGADHFKEFNQFETRTFLFNFMGDERTDSQIELFISNLIFVFLYFELHASIVSSAVTKGQILSLQDGYVYFSSFDENICGAMQLLDNFSKAPSGLSKWVGDILNACEK